MRKMTLTKLHVNLSGSAVDSLAEQGLIRHDPANPWRFTEESVGEYERLIKSAGLKRAALPKTIYGSGQVLPAYRGGKAH